MPTTLSLSCSRKIYELLGDTYETEACWKLIGAVGADKYWELVVSPTIDRVNYLSFPAPSFSETIRLLPKIAEKKGWIHWVQESDEPEKLAEVMEFTCWLYMKANTEEEGVAEVSKYLEKIL